MFVWQLLWTARQTPPNSRQVVLQWHRENKPDRSFRMSLKSLGTFDPTTPDQVQLMAYARPMPGSFVSEDLTISCVMRHCEALKDNHVLKPSNISPCPAQL